MQKKEICYQAYEIEWSETYLYGSSWNYSWMHQLYQNVHVCESIIFNKITKVIYAALTCTVYHFWYGCSQMPFYQKTCQCLIVYGMWGHLNNYYIVTPNWLIVNILVNFTWVLHFLIKVFFLQNIREYMCLHRLYVWKALPW